MRFSILAMLVITACSRASMVEPVAPTPGPVLEMNFNGQKGMRTLTVRGEPFTFGWVSSRATSCEMVTPVRSGLSLVGHSASISPDHNFYPAKGKPVTFTIFCKDGEAVVRDSVLAYKGS